MPDQTQPHWVHAHKVTPVFGDVSSHRCRVHEQARKHHRADLVHLEGELCDDAEVSTASTQCPEQVCVLAVRSGDDAAVSSHNLARQQVVTGEAKLTFQPAASAAQA